MTDRLKTLEADIDTARRSRDQERLGVLTLLMSKVQRIAKDDGNRAATDADLIQGVSRYRKEVEEMRDALSKAGRDVSAQDAELAVVTAYLPQQLTEAELDSEIENALASTDRSKKAIGAVMRHLSENFGGRYDPKKVKPIVDAKLA